MKISTQILSQLPIKISIGTTEMAQPFSIKQITTISLKALLCNAFRLIVGSVLSAMRCRKFLSIGAKHCNIKND